MRAGHIAARNATLFAKPKPKLVAVTPEPEPRPEIPLPTVSAVDMAAHEKRILGYVLDVERKLRIRDFIARHATNYGVSYAAIIGSSRVHVIVLKRHKIMWLARRQFEGKSFPELGRAFGGKDHTTIMSAVGRIDKLIADNDPRVSDLKQWVTS